MPKSTLSQDEIISILWKACDTFRGTMDPSEYKNYILVMLFVKYISDVWQEQFDALMKKYSGDEVRVRHQLDNEKFKLPLGCTFAELYAQRGEHNLGEIINKALEAIEHANKEKLDGVFRTVDFNSSFHLGGLTERNERLNNLLTIFHNSRLDMRPSRSNGFSMIGDSLSHFIDGISLRSGKRGGEFYTPIVISELLTQLVKPFRGEKIYDPACGSVSLLLKGAEYVGMDNCSLYGQEVNGSTHSLAILNMLLHGVNSADIRWGDTLRSPLFLEDNRLMKFDVVVSNPPFAMRNWGYEEWTNDNFGRSIGGVPPKNCGDFAWIQHVIASLKTDTGRAAIIVPHGVLFRAGAEGEIRKRLIETDILEAVLSLGPGLMYFTGVALSILVLRINKAPTQKGKIILLNAATLFEKALKRNALKKDHLAQILDWYQSFKEVPGSVRIVSIPEIAANNWNLNLSHYIRPEPGKLLEHAIISIRLGIEDYETGDENRIFSSMRNLYAGMLLLFKEKLLRLSPDESEESLIKAKIIPVLENEKIVFKGSGKKTVEINQIKERFEKLGINVDWKRVDIVRDKRNDIEHYYSSDRKDAVREVLSSTFIVIRDFIQNELGEKPRDLLGAEYWQIMLTTSELFEDQRVKCLDLLNKIDWSLTLTAIDVNAIHCPSCNSSLIQPSEGILVAQVEQQYFTCESCGQTNIYNDLIKALLANQLDNDNPSDILESNE